MKKQYNRKLRLSGEVIRTLRLSRVIGAGTEACPPENTTLCPPTFDPFPDTHDSGQCSRRMSTCVDPKP